MLSKQEELLLDLIEAIEDQEPLNIMVLTKEFDPNLEELGKDFTSEENKAKRAAYKANYTREQKQKVYDAWVLFMRDLSRNVPFFIYFEMYYGKRKQFCVLTKAWTIEGPNATKEVVRSSHPPLEAITFDHRRKEIIASPFKVATDRHQPVDKVIEQNNYTNQCIHVIGKQLDRIEDKIENKVILQSRAFIL